MALIHRLRRRRRREDSSHLRNVALEYLRTSLNDPHADFRDGQWEAIERLVVHRERLLVVQRTGWGKSAVYFVATRLLRDRGYGPTLVISPLISLMRNQLLAARRLGVRAETMNSANYDRWGNVRQLLDTDEVDVLLISPERLANDRFREDTLPRIVRRIGLFVVDEAHCISDWGHDFRPDYRRISQVVRQMPRRATLLATTATANNRVVADVAEVLGRRVHVVRGPLGRESLSLSSFTFSRGAERLAWLVQSVRSFSGSGIIYTLTVRDAQQVAEWLRANGINAHSYWADLPPAQRDRLETDLLTNRISVLVATVALGMGFDKPDLQFVIHCGRPGSTVAYYQQVGRAGRAIPRAHGVLLSCEHDRHTVEHFIRTAFPRQRDIDDVLHALAGSRRALTPLDLEREVNLSTGEIERILTGLAVLKRPPIQRVGTGWVRTRAGYRPERGKADELTRLRRVEMERMELYSRGETCHMEFLVRDLDGPDSEPCGRCAACLGRPLLPADVAPQTVDQAVQFLRLSDQIIQPRERWPAGALTRDGLHGPIPTSLRIEPGRALSIYGNDGWGDVVRHGKEMGTFPDVLVEAAVTAIRDRWQPRIDWVTCVPSLARPTLVPDFARRLAAALDRPFVPCVHKVRPTGPQKSMQNSYRQAANLAGVFEVGTSPGGNVLLVDDMVDSGWTMAVVGALLRRAGSGPVFPFALAMSTRT